jgi:hypothetical protein
MQPRNKLAVAMTAMSIAAAGGGIGAAAAQAQDEVLQSTTTTFWVGGSGTCFTGIASAGFSAAGPATGPYAGTFTETNANVRVSTQLNPISRKLTLSIPFTINSGSTTITGTITNPPPYSGGGTSCRNFYPNGPSSNANAATYTATIQSQGQPAQTVSGTAQFSAAFEFMPHVVAVAPAATLLNFPAP